MDKIDALWNVARVYFKNNIYGPNFENAKILSIES